MEKSTFETPEILILSHGSLCTALVESAEMICGEARGVTALPFISGTELQTYAHSAKAAYDAMPVGSVIFFDLFCGTPFNQMLEQSDGSPMYGLCGVNLPMLIDALNFRESLSGQALIDAVAASGRESMVDLSKFIQAG